MKVKSVSYRRTRNLGNYESASVEFVAELDEDEDEDEIMMLKILKEKAEIALGIVKETDSFDDF